MRGGGQHRRMAEYINLHEVIRRLRQFGAEVETDSIDSLKKSIGDFAELTESVVGIQLRGAANGDEAIAYMVSQHDRLLKLRWLNLCGSVVSDESVRRLSVFRHLSELDLSRTPITSEALHVVLWLPDLKAVRIEGTGLKLLTRWKLAAKMRRKRKVAGAMPLLYPTQLKW
jgi:hypothetical protein